MTEHPESTPVTRWYADQPDKATPHDAPAVGLDEDLAILDDAHARRLNKRALWILGPSVLVLLGLMLWVGNSFGTSSATPLASKEQQQAVESPDMPGDTTPVNSPYAASQGEGGSGGTGSSAMSSEANGLPPLPPEPIQLTREASPEQYASEPSPAATSTLSATAPARDQASLLQRRIWNGNDPDASTATEDVRRPDIASAGTSRAVAISQGKVRRLQHPSMLLVRGTYLRCALASRLVSDLQGYASCVLVEPAYAVDGRNVLLPKGTRLLGQYASGASVGDRLEVRWDRALTPDGLDVVLGGSGTDTLGGAGHLGKGSSHWGERIASAMLISILSDGFKYAAAKNGPRETEIYAGGTVVSEPFNSNTAQAAQALAEQALSQGAGRPRTVVIKQGTLLNVYVTEDIDFNEVLGNTGSNG